jgi:hypothetical protein
MFHSSCQAVIKRLIIQSFFLDGTYTENGDGKLKKRGLSIAILHLKRAINYFSTKSAYFDTFLYYKFTQASYYS